MKGSKTRCFTLLAPLALILAVVDPNPVQADQGDLMALVTEAAGKVAYRVPGEKALNPVQVGETRLTVGHQVLTGPKSKVTLQIEGKSGTEDADHPSQTSVEIGPLSRVMLSELLTDLANGNENIQIAVAEGQVIANVRKIDPNSERFEVETPTAIAAVRGTKFATNVLWKDTEANVSFRVDRGRISLFNRRGSRLADVLAGDTADIDPAGGVSVSTGASSGGGKSAAGALGAGKGGAAAGEGSDTIGAPPVDEEDDDPGHHE